MSVETIRDIPLIVQHRKGCRGNFEPMDYEYCNSGFPFDNSGRRTRDPLEDIAQRHPEFAQHLQGFPRRSQRTGGDQDQDEFLRRRFERPFSSGRFERFGFPFDRDDFEREPQRYYEAYPEYFENFQNQQPQTPPQGTSQTPSGYQKYPPQYSQQYQPQQSQEANSPQYKTQQSQSVSQGTQTEESESQTDGQNQEQQQQTEEPVQPEPKSEGGQTRGRPIQQSNTCDLAQHQPPDEALNERGQRSMSAPPENKRFTSSVNIPMGVNQETNTPQPGGIKSQASTGSTERVIPIHVEGRDDPVVPKNVAGSGAAPSHPHQQPQPERIFSESPRSQPETIFGRRPDAFTQFVNRDPHRFPNDWPHSFRGFPEEDFGFDRSESPSRFGGHKPQPHQQHRQEAAPQQTQAPKPQPQEQKQEAQQQTQPPPQPQPQKQPASPLDQIQAIQKDVATLLRQVEAFNGIPKDKNYLYLDEMLTRNILKLDNIDTQGQDSIRSARKEAIKSIEKAIGLLEARAAANVAPKEEKMELEQSQGGDKMDTEGSNQEPKAMSPQPAQNENMEVQTEPQSKSESTEQQQPKSTDEEPLAKAEEQIEAEEIKSEGVATNPEVSDTQKTEKADEKVESKENENQSVTEAKEGEKKEKKKIKKKAKEEKKQ